jgi:hypothetical protein
MIEDKIKQPKRRLRTKRKSLTKIDKEIRERNKLQSIKNKKIKRDKERGIRKKKLLEKFASEHDCIRRDKRCLSKEQADEIIREGNVRLGKFYCKKCKCYHLTSKV